jgi:L-asparaginase
MADILILTTGGTIDKVYFDALSEFQVGDSMVPRLLSVGLVKQEVRLQEVARKDSLDLDDADRAALRAAVEIRPESRIIITHGTDTMTNTAAVLKDIAGKTICMFGAMTPRVLPRAMLRSIWAWRWPRCSWPSRASTSP